MIFCSILVGLKTKKPRNQRDFEVLILFDYYSAEEEGFEPPDAFTSPVFKTGAINHSTTPLFIRPFRQLANKAGVLGLC